jgi:hypothetical protein
LELRTASPGFSAEVWATGGVSARATAAPGSRSLAALGWTQLSPAQRIARVATVSLAGGRGWRDYLVWITALEPGAPGAAVSAQIGDVELMTAAG